MPTASLCDAPLVDDPEWSSVARPRAEGIPWGLEAQPRRFGELSKLEEAKGGG